MLRKNNENINGMLHIGGVSVGSLIEKYRTPLYIYDEKLIKNTARAFKDNFTSDIFDEIGRASFRERV